MGHDDVRALCARAPFGEECRQILDPWREIAGVAAHRIVRQPARSALPAPVEAIEAPAATVPMLERLIVFFKYVPAPTQEKQAAALSARPGEAAEGPAVRRVPAVDRRARRHHPPVHRHHGWLRVRKAWRL